MSKLIAIIAGVGPGTGAAVARKFAAAYPVVLLARNPSNFDSLVSEINGKGGKAIGISTDVSDAASVKNAIDRIHKEFGKEVAAAVGSKRLRYLALIYLTNTLGCHLQPIWRVHAEAILGADGGRVHEGHHSLRVK